MNAKRQTASDVQIPDVERVVFDESAARFDHVAHQNSKHLVGLSGVVLIQIDPKEFAVEWVHRGGEQFLCVHLTESLEPFDRDLPLRPISLIASRIFGIENNGVTSRPITFSLD